MDITNHPNFERQLELEAEMRALGVKRYQDLVAKMAAKGQEGETRAVRRLVDDSHLAVRDAVTAWLESCNTGKAGRKAVASRLLEGVDLDLVAHLTVRTCLDSVSTRERLQQAARKLGSLIHDELRFRHFKEADKDAYWWTQKKLATTTHTGRRHGVMRHMMVKAGVEWEEWSVKDTVLLGTKLIELFCEATGRCEIVHVNDSPKTTSIYLQATQATLDWLKTEHGRLEWLTPTFMPTLVPPRPWTSPFEGGYWSGRVRRLTLVKTPSRAYLEELAGKDMPEVYAAVNAIQETAWKINTQVLDVMLAARENLEAFAEIIPQVDDPEPPVKPAWLTDDFGKENMSDAQMMEFKDWKRAVHNHHADVAMIKAKRILWDSVERIAVKFRDEDEIYFPHQLDWRGRVYPVPLHLHPQGSDACRGLLHFANTVPITDEEGAQWLAVHGAGCWGVDKVSIADRVAWVKENEATILAVAEDPLGNHRDFWINADKGEKPWQALAFCFEWAGYVREGYAFESRLPVQMDGTCNGLQNFSAILRDAEGGAAVNLVPSDKPNDIYMDVARLVAARVEQDAMDDSDEERAETARGWIGRVTRSVTKQPVMTLAYGATQYGFSKMVFDNVVKPLHTQCKKDGAFFPWKGNGFAASTYMGRLIWECVGEVVKAAPVTMKWLQDAAKVAAAEGLPVIWHAPTGFMVQQCYRVPDMVKLEMTFNTARIVLAVENKSTKIDKARQASGIAPNWVHSLDASHLMRTVLRGHAEGLRSFSLIHDSYGTHAGNAWALAQFLRQEFVRMYTETDVMAQFKEELEELTKKPLAPLPEKGTLDLSLVEESTFFFS